MALRDPGQEALFKSCQKKRNTVVLPIGNHGDGWVESDAHDAFQKNCIREKLPVPIKEFKFCPTRRWRLDYAWPKHRVALEVEGGIWTRGRHTRGSGFARDMEKYNELACIGWRLLRCTPNDLSCEELIEAVRRVLA